MALVAVADTVSIAAGGSLSVQPPSGETWDITTFAWGPAAGTATDAARVDLYDGTDSAALNTFSSQPTNTNGLAVAGVSRVVLTNSQYARMLVGSGGGSLVMGYRGVKL